MLAKLDEYFQINNTDNKKTIVERYKDNNSPANIIKLITKQIGSETENYIKFAFDLNNRKNCEHDHILKINNKEHKIEQKTSTRYEKKQKFMWQHIALDNDWEYILFVGIDYNDIKIYILSKDKVKNLIKNNKITNQGNKKGTSHQGYWCKYSNIAEDLIEIKTKDDLIKYIK